MCPKPSVSLTSRCELDNTLVPALCALSEVHYFQTFFGQSSEVAFHRMEAKRLADRAVNLDNQDPGAYCALARANMMSGDHGTASSYAETALLLTQLRPWPCTYLECRIFTMGVRTKGFLTSNRRSG